jgi:hypothetical protein
MKVGSIGWQLELLGVTALGAAIAVCPLWWAWCWWSDARAAEP